MEFRVHSAVVLAVTAAGEITTVATGSSSRYDGALEKDEKMATAIRLGATHPSLGAMLGS